jgi:hypothetical protein
VCFFSYYVVFAEGAGCCRVSSNCRALCIDLSPAQFGSELQTTKQLWLADYSGPVFDQTTRGFYLSLLVVIVPCVLSSVVSLMWCRWASVATINRNNRQKLPNGTIEFHMLASRYLSRRSLMTHEFLLCFFVCCRSQATFTLLVWHGRSGEQGVERHR